MPPETTPRPPRGSRRGPRGSRPRRHLSKGLLIALIAVALVIVLVIIALVGITANRFFASMGAQPPAVGTVVLAPAHSKASVALESMEMDAAGRDATDYLAARPTAYWLTPEQDPIGTVGDTVTSMAAQARDQGVSLALVVYGLPERDCGNHSAGGLSETDYPTWISEISRALRLTADLQTIVVLEPDSLALAPECGNIDERAAQLSAAVNQLASPATWIYLDGGHSNWLPVDEMAGLIDRIGVGDTIRGFATNVSNYQSTYDEFQYAHALAGRLGGLHALIDTSRNGAATAGDVWCNPPDQRVGEPGGTFGDEVVDTNLWIKPPGESDGPCNGGPEAGVWWPAGAAVLTTDVR